MPIDAKIWKIMKGDSLVELERGKLDLEERIEKWIEQDISIIADDLVVIGKRVTTDFGGELDLLCLDRNGDVVIVELKRDKTPREITAQILDYASWVKDFSNEKITEIAEKYFGEENSLEKAFQERFGSELPEILNEHHKMLVVASKIDSSTERIIKYLSDTYGVGINAVTFHYARDDEGNEFLARVFLIEPSEVDYMTQIRVTSKRKPPLSYEELQEIAERNGVGEFYRLLVEELIDIFDQKVTTRSTIAFIGIMDKKRNTIFSLVPGESASDKGVNFQVYADRFVDYFGIDKKEAIQVFPSYERMAEYEEWAGEYGRGFFKEKNQIEDFFNKLKEWKSD